MRRAVRLPVLAVCATLLVTAGAAGQDTVSRRAEAAPVDPAAGVAEARHATPAGLARRDWDAIRSAWQAGRHAVFAAQGALRARNPGQQWRTAFDGRGFLITPERGEWTWGLELQGYGRGRAWRAVESAAPVTAAGGRVAYARDDLLTEWFVNDARGLEHGFTLADRPAPGAGPLRFTLAIRGGLRAVVSGDGRDVRAVDEQGVARLVYAGLTVFDARGRAVPAAWTAGPRHLHLRIDDSQASYPLTIDPVAQQAYLKASNTEALDQFGDSVSISGDTVVVGAEFEDSSATGVDGDQGDNGATGSGAAYVFVRSGASWVQQAYLKASNTGASDAFGGPVAISGDTIVVGAHLEDSAATGVDGNQASNFAPNSGAAYVFVRSGTSWSQQAYLKASNTASNDFFGDAVAISGDAIVIGANLEDSSATGVDGDDSDNGASGAGAAYVFARSGTTWSQQAYLKASNTQANDWFGGSVAVSGDTVVVGARREESSAGAAYVFVREGTTWSEEALLKPSNTQAGDEFGDAVAVSGDSVLVGAPLEDGSSTGVDGDGASNSVLNSGAAYVFVRSGAAWTQEAYLKASNTGLDDRFGSSVALSGNAAVVGAYSEDSNATGVGGGGTSNSAANSGAAYVFARSGATWSPLAYLKASNTGTEDDFGTSVAVSGDTVVVGAGDESSGATGVDGAQGDDSVDGAGAAYVFDLDLLVDPWIDLGAGLAGVGGVPQLTGSGTLLGGEPVALALTNANPASNATLIIGLTRLNAPFKGGTFVPFADIVVPGLLTDASGAHLISALWPLGIPTGSPFWLQEWIEDPAGPQGYSASNGLAGTTP